MMLGTALFALAACEGGIDADFRRYSEGGFDTSGAALQATNTRPAADSRGVISYPSYQVVVARRGDTVADAAGRVGLPAEDLARYNGLQSGDRLREGEVLALPSRVSETPGGTVGGGAITGGTIDVTSLEGAIDRGAAQQGGGAIQPAQPATGAQPIRHRVVRGETAYSIARQYDVPVRSLADWNGLGPDLTVREGQYLLIPTAAARQPAPPPITPPGAASPTPTPPSAAAPLPAEKAAPTVKETPPSPNLGGTDTTSKARLGMPINGKIIRGYAKGKNEGIDIAATAGAGVAAAGDGTVAAITRDTDQVPIIVVRHDGNLLTVYAGLDAITVKKGDKVKRGQVLGKVRAANPAFVHFEVREGFNSTDPVPYLK